MKTSWNLFLRCFSCSLGTNDELPYYLFYQFSGPLRNVVVGGGYEKSLGDQVGKRRLGLWEDLFSLPPGRPQESHTRGHSMWSCEKLEALNES